MKIKNLILIIILASISMKSTYAQTGGSLVAPYHINICTIFPNAPSCVISLEDQQRICVSQCKVAESICLAAIVQSPNPMTSSAEQQECEEAYQSCVDACN